MKAEVRKLRNNVPVFLMHYPDSMTVTIGVSFNVGGRNEWKQSKSHDGISHFLEHQFFKGDESRALNSQRVSEMIDELGGMTNAFTTTIATCYFTKSLASEIDNAINLWSELLNYGSISKEEFDKESFVVRQEFKRFVDNPTFFLYQNLTSHLHEGTSLEMTVIGTEESLASVTLEEMEAYRAKHYDLSNAFIMILGNIDMDEVMNKLNNKFGDFGLGEKPSYELTSYSAPENTWMRLYRYDKHSPLGLFGIGLKMPGGRTEHTWAMQLLFNFLNLGKSSLIQERLIRTGLTAFAFADSTFYQDVSELLILVGAPPPTLKEAHNAAFKMLHDLLTMEVDEQRLRNLCDQIEFDLRKRQEEPVQVMFNQALDYWSLGHFLVIDDILKEIRAVTVEQFNKTRQLVLGKLDGAYMMMGSLGDFHPEFPEGTWEGEFE